MTVHARLHALNALLFVALWTFTFAMYPRLPELIPGHMGLSGVTRWVPRDSGMWLLLPLLSSFHGLLMYALSSMANGSPAGINIPQKDRLLELPREGQRYAMEPTRTFMFAMATWLFMLTGLIQVQIYLAAMAGEAGRGDYTYMLGTMLALALLPLAGVVWLSRAISHRIEEWEITADDDLPEYERSGGR
jgi:hypothetical protein